ncbi:MAG: DUF4249 domain-containing protein [Bacteroidales bacterium]
MRANNFLAVSAVSAGLALLASCIDPYVPEITDAQDVLVISGKITDKTGFQEVRISRSSPYNSPEFVPLSGCVVTVSDQEGTMAFYEEAAGGTYRVYLEEPFLGVGKAYSLQVVTPSGSTYQSTFDTLLACPPVEKLYYEVEARETAVPDEVLPGIQFFNDVSSRPGEAGNFRWVLEESWEYNAPYWPSYIWYGAEIVVNVSDSLYTCYMKEGIQSIFTASNRSLEGTSIKRNPLHFVSNESPRLHLRYGLQILQQSLTDQSYAYWKTMEEQAAEGGSLYETQPVSTVGNVYNVSDGNEKVLGCFYATQEQEAHLLIPNEFDFLTHGFQCKIDTIYSLSGLGRDYPYFLIGYAVTGTGPPYGYGDKECFDCKMLGGTKALPEYWYDENE